MITEQLIPPYVQHLSGRASYKIKTINSTTLLLHKWLKVVRLQKQTMSRCLVQPNINSLTHSATNQKFFFLIFCITGWSTYTQTIYTRTTNQQTTRELGSYKKDKIWVSVLMFNPTLDIHNWNSSQNYRKLISVPKTYTQSQKNFNPKTRIQ